MRTRRFQHHRFHLRRWHRRVVLFGSRPRGEAPQQMLFAVEQIQQRPVAQRSAERSARAAWDWECHVAVPADCPSFPSQSARALRAHEAEIDQAQVILDSWNRSLGYRRLQDDAGGSVAISGISGAPGQTGQTYEFTIRSHQGPQLGTRPGSKSGRTVGTSRPPGAYTDLRKFPEMSALLSRAAVR
jgi:hypothetical protein